MCVRDQPMAHEHLGKAEKWMASLEGAIIFSAVPLPSQYSCVHCHVHWDGNGCTHRRWKSFAEKNVESFTQRSRVSPKPRGSWRVLVPFMFIKTRLSLLRLSMAFLRHWTSLLAINFMYVYIRTNAYAHECVTDTLLKKRCFYEILIGRTKMFSVCTVFCMM